MNRRSSLTLSAISLLCAIALAPIAASGVDRLSTTSTVRVLTCGNKMVVKPSAFVISCADANSQLSASHWATWSGSTATGTTTFELNLCNPNCASSRLTNFPKSPVRFSVPVKTKKNGTLFSQLVVTYKLKGKTETFTMSWKGDPAFS